MKKILCVVLIALVLSGCALTDRKNKLAVAAVAGGLAGAMIGWSVFGPGTEGILGALAIGGVSAGKYRSPGSDEAYDIRMTLPRWQTNGTAPSLATLDRLYVATSRGWPVPLARPVMPDVRRSPVSRGRISD